MPYQQEDKNKCYGYNYDCEIVNISCIFISVHGTAKVVNCPYICS